MARRAPAGIIAAVILAAGPVAAQETEGEIPLSYYTAGGPPNTVVIIQEPATADDDALDLTSIIAAASALATGAGVIAARFKKARTATE
jgi:hypothetical protein